jgi:transposase
VTTIAQAEPVWVTVGVDTHRDLHVAGARDQLGRRIGTTLIPTTPTGYQQLLDWARHLGEITAFGIEGTGCYGAGLARYLRGKGYRVIEVTRPDRATRRRNGKSDPVDADAAARTVQAGDQTGTPKAGTGTVGRCCGPACGPPDRPEGSHPGHQRAAGTAGHRPRRAARAAPGPVEDHPAPSGRRPRPRPRPAGKPQRSHDAGDAVAWAAPRRAHRRDQRAGDPDQPAAHQARHPTASAVGVGPDSASALLLAAGDNPQRLHSEAAFAALCGASPVEASSGKTSRHRLM